MSETILWELMESEAVQAYYLDRKGFKAEKPGIIITNGVFLAPDAKKNEFYTVWFGQGIAHWNFKTLQNAVIKAHEILATSKTTITPRVVTK